MWAWSRRWTEAAIVDPDFRLMLETLADAVVAADRAGRIVYANPAAEKLLDWPRGALAGQPVTAIIPAHLRARHTAGFNRYRATWAPRVLGRAIRVAAARKGGAELRIELTLTAYRGGGGNELYLASLRPLSRQPQTESHPTPTRPLGEDPLGALLPLLKEAFEPEHVARRTVEALAVHFQATCAQLWLLDPETGDLRLLRPSLELAGLERPPAAISVEGDPGLLAEAARTRQPQLRRENLAALTLWAGQCGVPGLEAVQALPLVQGGALLGVLVHGGAAPLPEDLVRSLAVYASLVAGALQALHSAALTTRQQTALAQVEALRECNRAIAMGAAGPPLLQDLVRRAVELTGMDGSLLFRPEDQGWTVAASWGYRPPLEGMPVPDDEAILAAVLTGRRPWRSEAYASAAGALPALRQRGIRAVVAAPCIVRGMIAGVLALESRKAGRHLMEEDETRATAFAEQIAVVLEIERLRAS